MHILFLLLLGATLAFSGEVSPAIGPGVKTIGPGVKTNLDDMPAKSSPYIPVEAETETAATNPLLSGLNDEVWKMIEAKLEPRFQKLEKGIAEAGEDRTKLQNSVQKNKKDERSDESSLKSSIEKAGQAEEKDKAVMAKVEARLKTLNKEIETKVKPLEDFISKKTHLLNDLEGMANVLKIHVGDTSAKVPETLHTPVKLPEIKKVSAAPKIPEVKSLEKKADAKTLDKKEDIKMKLSLPKLPDAKSLLDKLAPKLATAAKSAPKKDNDAALEKKLEKIEKENLKKSEKDKKKILTEAGLSSEDAEEIFGMIDGSVSASAQDASPFNAWKCAFLALLMTNLAGAFFYWSSQKHDIQTPLLASTVP